ncbi:MAG: alanine--tRNA ligase [Vicinamibacterales bacterium]
MTSKEIRQGFLKYFEKHGHRVVASSPLMPGDDPTLLFTNAGMNQFKDVFLGKEKRDYKRAATSQKCMRVSGKHNDLDNVGPSLRHHTFFEMLGNFSFGDYFKADAIPFAWQLLTEVWKLDPDRLYPSIFKGEAGIPRDDEAYAAWAALVPADRIHELGASDNFWAMGDTGPCGRCSEIYYRRDNEDCAAEASGGACRGLECSCERYIEVWNNVFMEFDRQADGALTPLPALSVDTGLGLERIAAVIQGKQSNYDTDLFSPILDAIGRKAGRAYTATPETGDHPDVSMRVIADHLRAMTFLIADGVLPSNEWRGYVLRKIMRRAMRHGKKLGVAEPFLHELAATVIAEMGGVYPELARNRDAIARTIRAEEDRFDMVLRDGLPKLEEVIDRAAKSGKPVPGEDLFTLYDSLGVPYDFAEDLASQRGLAVDRLGFDEAMELQRERARRASDFDVRKGATFDYASDADRAALEGLADEFEGYTSTTVSGTPVVALFDAERRRVSTLDEGASGWAVLAKTPFYLEAGGQVSDAGRLVREGHAEAAVDGLARLAPGGPRAHRIKVTRGALAERDVVTASVDPDVRDATRRNHTATHLLHAALRQVLGSHVRQAGSLVAPDRLRFDFTHFQAVTSDERAEIERIVNAQILRNTQVATDVRSTDEAMAAGAMALFGEKYGDKVRVVSIDGFSMELCGGTHVSATGDIGFFVITQESGVAAGVRRIEALTGEGAVRHYHAKMAALARLVDAAGGGEDQAADAIARLRDDMKRLTRENEQLRIKVAMGGAATPGAADVVDAGGTKLIARRVEGLDKAGLRTMADQLRDRLKSGVVVLAAEQDGKALFVVGVTKDLTARLHAGNLAKELAPIVGGKGGGRPDFAEAGGKDPSAIDSLLAKAQELVAAKKL